MVNYRNKILVAIFFVINSACVFAVDVADTINQETFDFPLTATWAANRGENGIWQGKFFYPDDRKDTKDTYDPESYGRILNGNVHTTEDGRLDFIEFSPDSEPQLSIIWLRGLGVGGYEYLESPLSLDLPSELNARFIFPLTPIMEKVTFLENRKASSWFNIAKLALNTSEYDDDIKKSVSLVNELIEREIARGVPSDRIVLAGFSQGGVIAIHCGLRYPQKLAGILIMSSWFPMKNQIKLEGSPNNKKTQILMQHGTVDPVLKIDWAKASRNYLRGLGYDVKFSSYPKMEHDICDNELVKIAGWLKQLNKLNGSRSVGDTPAILKMEVIRTYTAAFNGNTTKFEERSIIGDGDCGFTGLGLERETAIEQLISQLNQSNILNMVLDDVMESFRANDLPQSTEARVHDLVERINRQQIQLDNLVRTLNEQNGNRGLNAEELIALTGNTGLIAANTALNNLYQDVRNRLNSEEAVAEFLREEFLNRSGHLSYVQNACGTLYALAYLNNLEVHIWTTDETGNVLNEIFNVPAYDPNSSRVIHLHHTRYGYSLNHFNSLEIVPETELLIMDEAPLANSTGATTDIPSPLITIEMLTSHF